MLEVGPSQGLAGDGVEQPRVHSDASSKRHGPWGAEYQLPIKLVVGKFDGLEGFKPPNRHFKTPTQGT